jgi:hypothetical protein
MMTVGMLAGERALQHAHDGREIIIRTANNFYGRRWHGTHHGTIDKALEHFAQKSARVIAV